MRLDKLTFCSVICPLNTGNKSCHLQFGKWENGLQKLFDTVLKNTHAGNVVLIRTTMSTMTTMYAFPKCLLSCIYHLSSLYLCIRTKGVNADPSPLLAGEHNHNSWHDVIICFMSLFIVWATMTILIRDTVESSMNSELSSSFWFMSSKYETSKMQMDSNIHNVNRRYTFPVSVFSLYYDVI